MKTSEQEEESESEDKNEGEHEGFLTAGSSWMIGTLASTLACLPPNRLDLSAFTTTIIQTSFYYKNKRSGQALTRTW